MTTSDATSASPSIAPDATRGTPGWLTVGVATAVAMWAVGYFCRLPGDAIPAPAILGAMVVILLVGGMTMGRHTPRGAIGGALAGGVTGLINLILVLSIVASEEATNELLPSAAVWIPGSVVASVVISALGGALMSVAPGPQYTRNQWLIGLVLTTTLATLMLLLVGGLVTTAEEGMAVLDWPNTEGSNMFLYPLAKMTGGIYFEHAHRLFGALIGLCTIITAVELIRARPKFAGHAIGLVILVVVQGVLGGGRVLMGDVEEARDDVMLSVVHGTLAQIFFAGLAVTAVMVTARWMSGTRTERDGAAKDRRFAFALLGFTLAQIIFGALLRQMTSEAKPLPWPGHAHLTLAAIVTVLALLAGFRGWSRYKSDEPIISRTGLALLASLAAQLVLGMLALVGIFMHREEVGATTFEMVFNTLHQVNGAIMFALAAILAASLAKLVRTAPA